MAAFHEVHCIAPSTHILTADLRWVEAGDITEAQNLMGFDEHGPRRKWQGSVVTRTLRTVMPCYDLTFSDGTTVRCSAEHRWLRTGRASYGRDRIGWIQIGDMRVGSVRGTMILKPLPVWESDRSYEAGYLAAAFDGEGHLRHRAWIHPSGANRVEFAMGFSQRDNAMLTMDSPMDGSHHEAPTETWPTLEFTSALKFCDS